MADLDGAIRAKLAAWGDDPCGYATCVVVGWGEMRAAIEAVIDLHPTIEDGVNPPHCAHCGVREIEPCPTKRVIAEKLGVEAADD